MRISAAQIIVILFCLIPAVLSARKPKSCADNEVYLECGICEGSCDTPIPPNCLPECKPGRCYCHYGDRFVRHEGKCIPLAACPNDQPDPCADLQCPENETCILDAMLCEKPPCPKLARCPVPQDY